MRMSSSARIASIPTAEVGTPSSAARASPSDAGSMPANIATSTSSRRSSLISRSVPMFPVPSTATLTGAAIDTSLLDLDAHGPDDRPEVRHVAARGRIARCRERAREDRLACGKLVSARTELVRQPGDRESGIAEHGGADALVQRLVVALEGHPQLG